jgi:YbbR domain-containing protein
MKAFFGSIIARLVHNIGYKLFALMLAFWWWTYAQSQQYPQETRTMSVKAQVSGDHQLVLPDGAPVVPVRLSGLREDLNAFDPNTLTARLDLSDAAPGRKQTLPVTVSMPPNSEVKLLSRTVNVEVMVDKETSERRKVEPKVGNVPANYRVSDVTCRPTEVTLSGSTSHLQRVRHVWVRINATNNHPNFSDKLVVEPVDRDGVIVRGVKVSPQQVNVSAALKQAPETRVFPIAPRITGSPAAGFRMMKLDYQPQTVLLSGEPNILKNMTAVETEPVDITGAQDKVTQSVALKLPEGVTAQGVEQVKVDVHIAETQPPPAGNGQ